jgi:glycosyltransferase involved in cell wall biosynthesis
MRLLVHDYCGHPFQVQLSRALASKGHAVRHLHSASFQTPKGAVDQRPDDPLYFEVIGLRLEKTFEKYSFVRRRTQELEYGAMVARHVETWRPDIVLSSNMPLDPQAIVIQVCRNLHVPFVFWLQDLHSLAIDRYFSQKLSLVGKLIGLHYRRIERSLLSMSDHIICITDDFLDRLHEWHIDPHAITVIRNWATLDDYAGIGKPNLWSEEHHLSDKFVFLYSGTLGLKHNPELLFGLAKRFATVPEVRVVVISEGPGANWLRQKAIETPNLVVLPFQPQERFGEVLATGDVLVALLSQDAGAYSVPSKVLSYLCAARPILAAIPAENLAARIINDNDAGLVVSPDQPDRLFAAANELLGNFERRQALGNNALAYAAREFDIGQIAAGFEQLLGSCVYRQQHRAA